MRFDINIDINGNRTNGYMWRLYNKCWGDQQIELKKFGLFVNSWGQKIMELFWILWVVICRKMCYSKYICMN